MSFVFQSRILSRHIVQRKTFIARYSRQPIRNDELAFVFDIDGVLVRGGKPIPAARPTLDLLQKLKIPFMLLTNGGGVTEATRTEFLSNLLNFKINKIQIVQSHTPFKTLTNKYKSILAVGGPNDKVRKVAYLYGFSNVVLPIDIVNNEPSVWPFHKYTEKQLREWSKPITASNSVIDAIMVFNDPRDMGSDLQIVLDLLVSENGKLGTRRLLPKTPQELCKPSIPIYFSNNDFLWANEYTFPRFGQGMFRGCVETAYRNLNSGVDIATNDKAMTILGKPNVFTYEYVHHALIDWRNKLLSGELEKGGELVQVVPTLGTPPTNSPFKKVYMVGDNPASDIKGANNYHWDSCLVTTGVYKAGDALNVEPTYIVNDVYESVTIALTANGIKF